jgi:hypothetical protein
MKQAYIVILLVLFCGFSTAQRSQPNWNYHLSNERSFDVVKADQKVYFVSEGGVYFYNLADNSINTLTKINGLSGSDFKGIEYSPQTGSLVIYYRNSMIDIIMPNGRIHPISDINRKNIVGDKMIYSATCHKNKCYLACGFGIVVLDLDRMEISDSFIIGDSGEYLTVYDVAFDNQNIYAGTETGLKFAPLDAPNLLDFNYWQYIEEEPVKKENYNIVDYAMGRIWLVNNSEEWYNDRTIVGSSSGNWYYLYGNVRKINSLKINNNFVVYTGSQSEKEKIIYAHNSDTGSEISITEYPFMRSDVEMEPMAAVIDDNGEIWIADMNYGGIRYRSNGTFDRLSPAGPVDNSSFALNYSDNKLWVAGGGYNSAWNSVRNDALFQGYSSGEWEYYNKFTSPELENFYDVVQVVARPGNPNHIFVATWGGGVLEYSNGKLINVFNESNSTLQNIIPGGYYTRIGGICFDDTGNMWVTTNEVEKVLHKRSPDGKWTGYALPEIANSYKIGKPLVAKESGDIWIMVPRDHTNGLYVMSSDGRNKKHLKVLSYFNNSVEEVIIDMNNVFDIKEDLDGKIWVGTSKGVAVFSNIDRVFETDPYYASQPGVDRNDGIYHPLLQNETVTAIAVDGGNRKYFGTRSSGLYYISEDGTHEFANFNVDNSPLISNSILSLEYDGDNGILYIGTDMGLVSLYTDSRKAFDDFSEVYAYPNPVRSGYLGSIYISGMMEDTNVKITTISGRLVYETKSIGGQAVWDGRDLSGRRVHTGIYLVFCATSDGNESTVTKIAFIR